MLLSVVEEQQTWGIPCSVILVNISHIEAKLAENITRKGGYRIERIA